MLSPRARRAYKKEEDVCILYYGEKAWPDVLCIQWNGVVEGYTVVFKIVAYCRWSLKNNDKPCHILYRFLTDVDGSVIES